MARLLILFHMLSETILFVSLKAGYNGAISSAVSCFQLSTRKDRATRTHTMQWTVEGWDE